MHSKMNRFAGAVLVAFSATPLSAQTFGEVFYRINGRY